jgi:PAS domain S-box-containing protein
MQSVLEAGETVQCQSKLRVLLVEDSASDAELVVHELAGDGFEVCHEVVQTEAEFRQRIADDDYDVILADCNLPQWRGMETIEILRSQKLDIPVILVTGSLGDVAAVECIKQGATDYVLKDKLTRLASSVRRALDERRYRAEREQAEAALQESENRLASVIASAMDAIVTVDEQQRIVLFNAAAERVFRCPAAEALGGSLNRFIPERFRAAHETHVQRYNATAITNRNMDQLDTLAGLRANGEEFPLQASISQVATHDGKLFTVILRDVTQQEGLRRLREQAERDLAKKIEELARSNADLEQFAYVASHDLQEPLRMVASYTQLLAERYTGKLDETADKYIRYAVEGAVRMQTLIQDLMAFSRVGRNGLELGRTDCSLVVKEAIQNLHSAIQESGAEVRQDALPVISADLSQLRQVFQNLLGNAIKFRGTETPVITVRAEEKDEEWQFAVQDNGIGIAREHLEIIFAIFQRLHTRKEYPGNGIGLAICKKIIERHGGRIWVESQPGKGTTFKFTIPTTKAEAQPQDAP